MRSIAQTAIPVYPLLSRGKVRDIYGVDAETLLIVTTDRMSAFDVILEDPVPYKGVILNQLTLFWMELFRDLVPNHLKEQDFTKFPKQLLPWKDDLEGRSVLVKKAKPLPVECIVRGYITGSGWKEYQKTRSVCGHKLSEGLIEAEKLPTPIFTPSTKAEQGSHDENITREQAQALLGHQLAGKVEELSLALYTRAAAHAQNQGIIIADTKFEFGLIDGELTLIDEVLTPDSSRFWPASQYQPGAAQPSFDKQYLRDWLTAQPWNKMAPAPRLPQEIIDQTQAKYREAYTRLSGKDLLLP